MNKKESGPKGPNQKELLNYGSELKEIVRKSFNPSGSGCLLVYQNFNTNKGRK